MVDNIWKRAGYESAGVINTRNIAREIKSGVLAVPQTFAGDSPEMWWKSDSVKGFRNAVVTRCIELIWDEHVNICENNLPNGIENQKDVVTALGIQNEKVMNTLLAGVAYNDTPPSISSIENKSIEYWSAFNRILEEGLETHCFENKLSGITDPKIAFWARGVRGIAIAFDLPNLITEKAEEIDMKLTSSQHRDSVIANLHGFVAQAYLPTLSVLEAFNDKGLDKQKLKFVPEAFESRNHGGLLLVAPKMEIITPAISQLMAEGGLSKETHCPFFSGVSEETGFNLPKSLEKTLLTQLDNAYYPLYE